MKKNNNVVHTSGRRKFSIARATLKPGKGMIRVNSMSLEAFSPMLAKMKIQEPLLLAGELAKTVDINVKVNGGGVISGAEAARLAIAKALVEYSGKEALREKFLKYDRNMLVADVRYKEPCKPNDSKARAKRQKSYR